MNEYGVEIKFTTNVAVLSTDQNVKTAVAEIVNSKPELADFEVVSSQTKDYVQHQEQILILTNGAKNVQVVGHLDQKTLRYVLVEQKEIPVDVIYPIVTEKTIPAEMYPIVIKKDQNLKQVVEVLTTKFKIFTNKVPIETTIEQFETSNIITLSYEVGNKQFVAVVLNDKTQDDFTIVEVNPIIVTKPVRIDQTTVQGRTITTTNSVQEIISINENTQQVLTEVTTTYPLLENSDIAEITLTEGDLNNVYEITYKDKTTGEETTMTVRSDKEGGNVVIEDVSSGETSIDKVVNIVKIPKVTLPEKEYQNSEVKKVISFVTESSVKVEKINKIVTETTPTYVTYHLEVESNNKPYEVTVIDNHEKPEIVSVHSTEEATQTQHPVKPTIVKEVNQNGNVIIKTNDLKKIETMEEVTTVVKEIKVQKKELINWNVDSVVTVDYGTSEGVTVTLVGDKPGEAVTSTVFYTKETKEVKVITIEKVTETK